MLKDFSQDKQWLAALAEEGPVFDETDPEDEQLIRALARFVPGSIKLLTRDQPLLDAHPDKTIAPTPGTARSRPKPTKWTSSISRPSRMWCAARS